MPLSPGESFERYEIVSLVGRGGMGEVYRAIDTRLGRPVALKVPRTDRDLAAATGVDGVARLFREARSAAALSHANSVAVYELGEAEGIPYIAMEFVTGESLRTYCRDRNVTIETKLGWLVDAARALWAAHKAGVVHRDIKPSNIMVSEEGVVKVLDFGLAKPVARQDLGGVQTLMGHVLGTPRYMAPEQAEGAPPDARADQFAFGVTAYELLSGAYPGETPTPLERIVPGLPTDLAAVVARMMARRPEERFATMEEAAHALRACFGSVRTMRKARQQGGAPNQAAAVDVTVPSGATLPLVNGLREVVAERLAALDTPASNRTLPLGTRAPSSQPSSSQPSSSQPSSSQPSSEKMAGANVRVDQRQGGGFVAASVVVLVLCALVGAIAALALR